MLEFHVVCTDLAISSTAVTFWRTEISRLYLSHRNRNELGQHCIGKNDLQTSDSMY